MLNPFIELIASLLQLYNLAIFIWIILGLLIHFDVVNRYNRFIQIVKDTLDKIIEPALMPIRRFMQRLFGPMGGIDLSPIILILLIQFVQSALYSWFWNL